MRITDRKVRKIKPYICNKEHGQMTRQTKAENIVHNTATSYYRNFSVFMHLDNFSITFFLKLNRSVCFGAKLQIKQYQQHML